MTREQRILRIISTLRPTDPGSWEPNTHYVTMEFNEHDAEQRQIIDEQVEYINFLEKERGWLEEQAKLLRKEHAEVVKVVENEPELPGSIPDHMWLAVRNDRDAVEELMRIIVRQTKSNILDQLKRRAQ